MPRELEVSVRTAGDPATTMGAMRRVMRELAPDLPIDVLSPLTSLVGTKRLQPLFEARLMSAFSILALVLAAVGTYSTLAYSVAQRTHELAIRVALGAQPANVVRLVLRRGAILLVVVAVLACAIYRPGVRGATARTPTHPNCFT
jgi:putative ABC transport system permease protein